MSPANRHPKRAYEPVDPTRPASVAPTEQQLDHELPVSSSPPHDPYAAFRTSNYRLYSFGSLFALVGTQIQSVAIGWEIYQRTDEALALGIVGLLQALPTIVLALPAGYVADILNRRKVAMVSLLGATAASLGLALLSLTQGSVIFMYGLLLLDAIALTLGRPARSALLPQLVSKAVFPNAMTWNSSLQQLASVLGRQSAGSLWP